MITTLQDRLIELILEHYVFPDVAEKIVAELHLTDTDVAGEQLAAQLTQRIQSVNHDRHLRVRYRESGAVEGAIDVEAHYAADAVRNAGGIRRIERLDASTGLLAIAPYTSPVHLAGGSVAAAFTLLAGVERLVIDLREGRGGWLAPLPAGPRVR